VCECNACTRRMNMILPHIHAYPRRTACMPSEHAAACVVNISTYRPAGRPGGRGGEGRGQTAWGKIRQWKKRTTRRRQCMSCLCAGGHGTEFAGKQLRVMHATQIMAAAGGHAHYMHVLSLRRLLPADRLPPSAGF
jgi:hypothetical protein